MDPYDFHIIALATNSKSTKSIFTSTNFKTSGRILLRLIIIIYITHYNVLFVKWKYTTEMSSVCQTIIDFNVCKLKIAESALIPFSSSSFPNYVCTYHMDSQALDSRKQNTTTNTVVQYNRKFQHQRLFSDAKVNKSSDQMFGGWSWSCIYEMQSTRKSGLLIFKMVYSILLLT